MHGHSKPARLRSLVVTKCSAPHHSRAGVHHCRVLNVLNTPRLTYDTHSPDWRSQANSLPQSQEPRRLQEPLCFLGAPGSPAPQARDTAGPSTSSVCMKIRTNDKTRPPGEAPSYLLLSTAGQMSDVQRLQRAALLKLLHAVP